MTPDLMTLTVYHRNGSTYTYRGVFIFHANEALNVMTLDYLDPADVNNCDAQPIVSFPRAAIDWWTERPYEGPPYILVDDEALAEVERADLRDRHGKGGGYATS